MKPFYRLEIVVHAPTGRIGYVQTDPFGNLSRTTLPIVLNVKGDPVVYLPTCECISLGFTWACAYKRLSVLSCEK